MPNLPAKAFCAPHTVMGGAMNLAGFMPQVDMWQLLTANVHAHQTQETREAVR